ncbi:MAG: 6-pyruvoyl-tetrahydropterin synthase-related protein [Thermoflexales bacterium]
MIHARRLLLALALTSAALLPLFSTELPRSADGRLHTYRIVLFAQHLRQGEWLPRYSPELVYGYGYPLFNYYAPLSYYLGAALHLLGLSAVLAFHALLGLALVVGAWGAWTFAAEWFADERAGALAAAAYSYAPYTLFNIFARGAAPEQLAVALLPWLLWSLSRALRAPAAPDLARLALLYAALLLTHNLNAFVGTAMLVVWAVAEAVGSLKVEGGRATGLQPAHLSLSALALTVGLLLSAFFWLPVFAEADAVQLTQLTAPATLDFRNYFLALEQLLTSTFVFDPRLEPPTVPVAFGLPLLILAALGGLMLWRQPDRLTRAREGELRNGAQPSGLVGCRARGAALLALLAAFLTLTLAASRPIWESVAPLKLFQFPWRFLGPATVCAALLVGALSLPLTRRGGWLSILAVLALTLPGFSWTFVTRFPPAQLPAQPAVTDIFAHEVESGGLGLTSTGEFLPIGVGRLPTPDAAWAEAAARNIAERLDRTSLPSGVTLRGSETMRLAAEARFESAQPFEATFRWFYFLGWQAEIDGQPAPIRAAEPFGFITVAVPAGAHTVRVFFGDTPLRRLAVALSLLGCIGLLALMVFARSAGPSLLRPAPRALPSAFYFLFLALFLLRVSLEHFDSPWRRSRFDGQAVSGAAQRLDLNFGDRLRLVGFDPPAPAPADHPLAFTLYWTLLGPADADYSVAAQLWDAEGHIVGQQDSQHPNGAPTRRWLEGSYAADAHTLTPYPGTPAGEYRLMVGVYTADRPSLEVRDASGLLLGRFYEAARVTVLPPTRPPTEAELSPAQYLRAPLGPLELIGVDGLRPQATAGDELPLVLYWRNAGGAGDWRLEIVLAGEQTMPLNGLPVSAGSVVRRPHTLRIPPEANGPADLQVSLLDSGGRRLAGPVTLGRVAVNAPLRSLDLPDIPAPLNARFGSGMELLGYGLSAETLTPSRALEVTLFWRARERMTTRYAVSVQLLDAQGQIVAQADGEPGRGARPTTGWLPPEGIADPHVLALPADMTPGAYVLQVVVYDPRTGARLPTAGPSDALALRTFELLP